jgi:isocitrate/isopropylmalate dehydrogenase
LVGTGKANPIATFLATAMMLDHLHENESAERLHKAVQVCIANCESTPDLGGTLTTNEVTERVIQYL